MDAGRRDLTLVLLLAFLSPVFVLLGLLVVESGVLGFGGPLPEPPRSTLAAGGEKRVGVATIGCWREKRSLLPDREVCISSEAGAVDERGRGATALRVSRGDSVVFEYGGASAPVAVRVRAARTDAPLDPDLAEKQDRRAAGREGQHFPPFGTEVERLPVERASGRSAVVPLGPEPGTYLVIFSVEVDDETAEGEAFYDFNVVVES